MNVEDKILRMEDKIWYVVFKGSNVVHPMSGYSIWYDERCPNCGVSVTGVLLGLDGRECWKDPKNPFYTHGRNLRFIKKPTGTGKYRFCKSKSRID